MIALWYFRVVLLLSGLGGLTTICMMTVMIGDWYWRVVLLLCGVSGLVAVYMTVRRPPSPDPRGKRLRSLLSDPLLTALPPGATRTGWREQRATYSKGNVFQRGSWRSPRLEATFVSTLSVQDVYHFYAERADEAGWEPTRRQPAGTHSWVKQSTGKHPFCTQLTGDFNRHSVDFTVSGIPRTYRLTGIG